MKTPSKLQAREKNPANSTRNNPINTPLGYSKKSRKQIYAENYIKNREKKKWYQRQRYAQRKNEAQKQVGKYSQASDYQVLMSLKEYTELNSAKHKKWLELQWVLQELSQGISDIADIMRLNELGENLISDYWETAKNEIRKGKSWNSLEQEQKDRLIRYWAREKVRRKQEISEAVEELEKQGSQFEQEIELAKFHEERGKKGCKCWQCQEKGFIQKEARGKINKEIEELEPGEEKGECCVCGKVRKLGEEGVCKECEGEVQ